MSTRTITLPADQWEAILEAVQDCWDEGPRGEGWQSSRLSAASAALSAALAQPEPEGVTDEDLMGLDDLRDAWNAQADAVNSWDELGIDEIIWFAQQQALARYARPAIKPKGTCQPNGYAYRYPAIDGTITRFNHGQEVNGCRPLYAIPYWLGQPPTARPTTEPVSEVLTDEAIEELTWRHTCEIGDLGVGIAVEDAPAFVRAALARWGRPAIEPVPVSKRLPGPEDCDAEGRCWWWCHRHESWELDAVPVHYRHWLPHHALPIPTP